MSNRQVAILDKEDLIYCPYCLTHKVEFFVNIENSNREVWLCRDNKYGNERRSCLRHFYVE
jgi:hypothetical protein